MVCCGTGNWGSHLLLNAVFVTNNTDEWSYEYNSYRPNSRKQANFIVCGRSKKRTRSVNLAS